MTKIESILAKIGVLETTLRELKQEVASLKKAKKSTPNKPSSQDGAALKAEYESLYSDFVKVNTNVVEEFIASKKKPYLIEFFRINSLPIDAKKISKVKIAAELRNWLAQRKAITEPMIKKKP